MHEYRLYGWRQTGSMAPEAALGVIGTPFELIEVSRETDENLGPAFLAINPRGQLPALVTPDGTVVTEGPAILTQLGDAFPEAGLIPRAGTSARALHDRWMAFCQANIYEGMLRQFYPDRYTNDPAGIPGVKAAADFYVNRHFNILEDVIASERPFFFGSRMQMIDIYIWMLCYWLDGDWMRSNCRKVALLFDAADALEPLRRVAIRHFG